MKRSDVFNALFNSVRSGTSHFHEDHNASFYSSLHLASVAQQLFGFDSPEYSVIQSYCKTSPPSLFVGPLRPGGAL